MHRLRALEPRRKAGFGLLETMLLLALMTTAIIAGYLYVHYTETARIARQQEALLQQADRQVQAFAVDNFRLPCPDTNNDGVEDCSSNAVVGRLPYKTLGLDGAQINTGVNQLRYQVARSGTDLAVASNTFEPTDLESNVYAFDHLNGTDFCTVLSAASSTSMTRAYAVAAPGAVDKDGDGSLFDGKNTGTTELDSPTRAGSASYDDHVLSVTPYELGARSGCNMTNHSLQAMTLSYDVISEVNDQNADSLESAQQSMEQLEVSEALLVISIYLDYTAEKDAAEAILIAAGRLTENTIACAALDLEACVEMGLDVAAIALGGVAEEEALDALYLHLTAYAPYIIAMGDFSKVIQETGGSTDATVDLSSALSAAADAVTAVQEDEATTLVKLTSAQEAVTEDEATLSEDKATLSALVNVYATSSGSLSGSSGTSSSESYDYDALLAAAESAAEAYAQAEHDVSTANSTYTQAKKEVDTLESQISDLDDEISALKAETSLSSSDEATLESDQEQLKEYQSDLEDAETALAEAESDLATYKAAETSAETAYDEAVAALLAALATNSTCALSACGDKVSSALDAYMAEYLLYLQDQDTVTTYESSYAALVTKEEQLETQYETLQSESTTTTSTSAVNLWSTTDAETVLNKADAKGTAE